MSAAPITDANGTWRGVRGVCRDITAERERVLELGANDFLSKPIDAAQLLAVLRAYARS